MKKPEMDAYLDKLSLSCRWACVEELSRIVVKSSLFLLLGGFIALTGSESSSWASHIDAQVLPRPEVSPGPTYVEAKILLDNRKWDAAATAFRALSVSEPKSLPIAIGYATALTRLGKREEGLHFLAQAVGNVKGGSRQGFIRRMRVLSRQFLTNKTFQIYQEGLNLLLGKKYRLARDRFEKALSEEPDNLEILVRLGQSQVLDNDLDSGIEKLSAATKLNSFEPAAHLWLGRALFLKASRAEALTELKNAYAEMQFSEQAAIWLAEALTSSGQSGAALRILSIHAKKWPEHVLSLITAAKIRIQTGHLDAQTLGVAQRELQSAMNHLDRYSSPEISSESNELDLNTGKPSPEIKNEIQRLMQQAQTKINEINAQR